MLANGNCPSRNLALFESRLRTTEPWADSPSASAYEFSPYTRSLAVRPVRSISSLCHSSLFIGSFVEITVAAAEESSLESLYWKCGRPCCRYSEMYSFGLLSL